MNHLPHYIFEHKIVCGKENQVIFQKKTFIKVKWSVDKRKSLALDFCYSICDLHFHLPISIVCSVNFG